MTKLAKVVVVVDDNAGILKSVARFLSVHGFEVRMFNSAEALIDSGDVEAATCLLLDINLGTGMSGIDLQQLLAASRLWCRRLCDRP